MLSRPLAALAAVAVLSSLAACSGDDEGETATDPSTSEASDSSGSGVACEYAEGGAPAAKDVEAPPSEAAVSGDVAVTIATGLGDVAATLDADATPCTVNSFVSLAEQGYFNDTQCHRLTTAGIFVLQCGDPTATGSGGPGYAFDDELTGEETYPAGTLAMANAGPGTNGSQFFIVYGDTQLPPAYTVFGTVDAAGVKLVEGVAAEGSDNANGQGDGAPNQAVEIESVTVG
jgi:peptidyl-prolyl cis-trans isomerase B (cyclophilin B)